MVGRTAELQEACRSRCVRSSHCDDDRAGNLASSPYKWMNQDTFLQRSTGIGGRCGLVALILAFSATLGCSSLRLPAIDPNGRSILLPPPLYTTLESPLRNHGLCFPQPAFRQPPVVPPCQPPARFGPCAQPLARAACPRPPVQPPTVQPSTTLPPTVPPPVVPSHNGQMQLTPSSMVVPVGSEVVLLAGLCGADGRYLMRQEIEWLLSQDSVGQFVDVGRRHRLAGVLHQAPRKFSNNFARTRTSHHAGVITRGTASAQDDIAFKKGQTWITLSSATPGVSYVTAVANGEQNWDQRRRTATIRWVDAQVTLPPAAVVRAGQPHLLITNVRRSSSGAPAAGWTVRYEVVGGTPAHFGQPGQTSIATLTDDRGNAGASLVSETGQPGATQIRIQVLSPSAGNLDPVVVNEGLTTATWSASGLTLNVSGPDKAPIESPVTYRIEVTNPGDLPTTNLRLVATLPDGLAYQGSKPAVTPLLSKLRWQLGELPAGQSRVVEFTGVTKFEGDLRVRFNAEADGRKAEAHVTTSVIAPSLQIRLVDPPQTAQIGDQIHFNVAIKNVGVFPVSNAMVRDTFDPGLEHTAGERSPIERTLGNLAPQSEQRFAVSFVVRSSGELCHTLEAWADGGHRTSKRVCIQVVEPTRDLFVEIRGPAQRQVGETFEYEMRVTNTGQGTLNRVRIFFEPSASLATPRASRDVQRSASGLYWEITNLIPDETQARRVECRGLQPNPAATSQVTVTTSEGITRTDRAVIEISPPGSPAGTQPGVGPSRRDEAAPGAARDATAGRLRVSLAENTNPVDVGQTTTYLIDILNDRDVADRDVVVTFEVPDGFRFLKFRSDAPLQFRVTPDRRNITVDTIREIRPNQIRRLSVLVEAVRPGDHTFRVRVKSQRSPEPIDRAKETRVRQN